VRLEDIAKRAFFDAHAAYGGVGKQDRRAALAEQFKNGLLEVPPSRLLSLLGQALKWQHTQVQWVVHILFYRL
jgi:WD40 repeat-containing protein SMU1